MGDLLEIEFGKGKLDQFGYLLVTLVMIAIFTILTRVVVVSTGLTTIVNYTKYELLYTMIGALFGIMASRYFKKKHKGALRKTYSRGSIKG